jgi:hypothetical protein
MTEEAVGHHLVGTRVLKLNLRRMCKRRHRPSFCRSAFGVTSGYLLLQGVGKGAAGLTFTFSRRSFPWATMEFITLFGAVGFFSQVAILAAFSCNARHFLVVR